MKYHVMLGVDAYVALEVEAPKGATAEEIYKLAYKKASLSDVQAADWNNCDEILDEDNNVIEE